MAKKITYLLLLFVGMVHGQNALIFENAVETSKRQATTEPSGELYPFDDAAGPNDTNSPPDAGWADVYSNPTGTESVESDGIGGYGLKFEIDNTGSYRPYFLVNLTSGVVYNYIVNGVANATSQVRILDPQIPGGDYAGISSQPFFTTSNATYNLTLSPPTTGTYRIQFNFNSPSDDDWVRINSISIIAQ